MDFDSDVLSLDALLIKFSGFNWYLYSQNAAWMEPSKVNIYYGVWRRFNLYLDKGLFDESLESYLIDSAKGLKSYGVSRIKPDAREFVASNFAGGSDNCLIISTNSLDEIFQAMESNFGSVFSKVDFFCNIAKTNSIIKNLRKEYFVIAPDFSQYINIFRVVSGKLQN